jgi:DNA polymerase III epsilon subunit-like protein
MEDYSFYVADCETTGLNFEKHSPIEISIYRLSNDDQKTWLLQPINLNEIETIALRTNGHKLEDLKHETKYGRENYKDPNKVIIEIENWLSEDMVPAEHRCLIGHNISFDRYMLESLWAKCNSSDSFPFGRRFIDTMVIELFNDYCKGGFEKYYNLGNVIKKYGVKNEKAHSALADTKATKEVFMKQVELAKKMLANG